MTICFSQDRSEPGIIYLHFGSRTLIMERADVERLVVLAQAILTEPEFKPAAGYEDGFLRPAGAEG